jgi:hypothetical protein
MALALLEWGSAAAAVIFWVAAGGYYYVVHLRPQRLARIAHRREAALKKQRDLDALAGQYLAKSEPPSGA